MFKFIPPVGHPIKISDIFLSIFKNTKIKAEESINNILSVKNSITVSSGTTALYLILKTLKEHTRKNEVIIPAYTCPSLIASAVRAGMKVNICDINKYNFDFDIESLNKLITEKTAAIIAVHLFGIPADINRINNIAKENNIFVVEDSTQAFGVEFDKSILGLSADIGFFSFGRGKPVSMLAGGAIVAKSEQISDMIQKEIEEFPKISKINLIFSIIQLIIYKFLVLPRLFWIPNSLPFLKIGETEYREDFNLNKLSTFHNKLITKLLVDYKRNNSDREKKANYLFKELKKINSEKIALVQSNPTIIPYLRFPVLLLNETFRNKILIELRKAGIGATDMYRKPLNKISGVPMEGFENSSFENAEKLSKHLLTIPVNSYTKFEDLDIVISIIKQNVISYK